MNILCFVPALAMGKGGAERVAADMAGAMAARGHRLTMSGFVIDERAIPAYALADGVKWSPIRRSEAAVRQQIARSKPDVIFALTALSVTRLWTKSFADIDTPIVLEETTSPQRIIRQWAENNGIDELQAAVHRHAFLSEATKIHVKMPSFLQSFPKHLREDVFAFGNAIRTARKQARVGASKGRKAIINVGGLKLHKNPWPLLDAFKNLSGEFPDWDLVICGEGPLRRDVLAFSNEAGLKKRILLTGDIDDIYDHYERAHLHVISSLEEGNPNAVCESMAHGVPSIGFAECSGTNEHIRHGKNGLLAEADDQAARLQECMQQLMGDTELRRQFGRQAFRDSETFNSKTIYDTWENLFEATYAYKGNRHRKRREREALAPRLETLYARIRAAKETDKKVAGLIRALHKELGGELAAGEAARTRSKAQIRSILQFQHKKLNKTITWLDRVLAVPDLIAIRFSKLFDAEYYRQKNPDVVTAKIDPAVHYYFHGAFEGRNPSEQFDSTAYLQKYPDVVRAEMNPLLHYIKFGRREGRALH